MTYFFSLDKLENLTFSTLAKKNHFESDIGNGAKHSEVEKFYVAKMY